MNDLHSLVANTIGDRFTANAARIRELAAEITDAQFWTKPFPFGNSLGHLVLHLTGNLNYYIGAQIAQTGYVRDRPREFTEASVPSKEDSLEQLDATVAMVTDAIRHQSSLDWARAYTAVGTNCANRLDIVMQCAAHMQHHIGQMIYLMYELKRRPG